MGKINRYFVQTGINFLDFSLAFEPEATLAGQDIFIKGTNASDVVYVAGGFNLDFSESLLGEDVILLKGLRSDFQASLSGTTLKLTRADNSYVIVSDGDKLVFQNGSVSTRAWISALNAQAPDPALNADENSAGSVAELATRFLGNNAPSSVVQGFGGGSDPNTFAQVLPGMQLFLKGTSADDVVYVKAGSAVDFSESLGGIDRIYMTGAWQSYSKSINGTSLRLTRGTEQVDAGRGDLLIFADGSVPVDTVFDLLPGDPSKAALGVNWRTDIRTPGVGVNAGTLGIMGFEDSGSSDVDLITQDPIFELRLSGQDAGTVVLYQQSQDGGGTWTDLASGSLSGLADGRYRFRAKVSNLSEQFAYSSAWPVDGDITVDKTPPGTPTLTLASDSGSSSNDGYSSVGTVNVGGLEGDATVWQYSLNGGSMLIHFEN